MSDPEVWLRGPVRDVPPHLQPVAHSLLQCREELERLLAGVPSERIWRTNANAASIGFHVLHAAGSLDRLFTYARGEMLSEAQRQVLAQESQPDTRRTADDLLTAFDAAVERALDQLRDTAENTLTAAREVGRARAPSTVLGLLFHAAEHAQRHVGQAVTTNRLMGATSTRLVDREISMLQQSPMYSYLPAKDVARARAFYEQKLGFRPLEETGGGVVYEFGKGTACFLYPTPNAGTNRASQAFWRVADVEREVAELTSRGVTFEEYDMPGMKTVNGILTAGGAKTAWFTDTEGNILAIVQDVRG